MKLRKTRKTKMAGKLHQMICPRCSRPAVAIGNGEYVCRAPSGLLELIEWRAKHARDEQWTPGQEIIL